MSHIRKPSFRHLLASRPLMSAPVILRLPRANANTLTALIPDIYAAMFVISRELVGFIPSVQRAASMERAAVGQSVKIPVPPVQAAQDITPSMTVPTPPDNTFTTESMVLTKARAVPFGFTGEEQVALNNGGPGYLSARAMIVAQAMRKLCNEIEVDLAVEATANASRAWGTAGTTPFSGDTLSDMAQIEKLLDDNGAPGNRSLILNTSAAASLQTVKNITRVQEAGSQMTLSSGQLIDIFGFSIKKSAQTVRHTAGTAASATTNGTGYAVGATAITMAAAGTGTILAGDAISFAGDPNKYVVAVGGGLASAAAGGLITINAPGLKVAIPATATAATVSASFATNVAFSQDAMAVGMRPPAYPQEGDLALDRMVLTDPYSGVSFEFAIYAGYRMVRFEVALVWGVKAVQQEHIGLVLG